MKSKPYKILTINPGSTSTKIAYFEDLNCISATNLKHESKELEKYNTITDQYLIRKQAVNEYLEKEKINADELDAVVGRGGLLKPVSGGTYLINDAMLNDLKNGKYGHHACNLGAILASEVAWDVGIPAYIVNPVVVDEMDDIARISGMPELVRKSRFHALNHKAVAIRASRENGKEYGDVNLIIAHMGGGISVAAHKKGRAVDVNDALEEGPFSPERSGTIPAMQLVDLCFSGSYTKEEIKKKIAGKGGLYAYLGTSDAREVEKRIKQGDKQAMLLYEAMAYQIAKEIAANAAVLCGVVDYIILTGGLAYGEELVKSIIKRVEFIAPVLVYPGEDEMTAMADGALRVLKGEKQVKHYE